MLALVLACSGCSSGGQPVSGAAPVAGGTTSSSTAARSSHPPRRAQTPQPVSCPARVLSGMTVAQRVGQLFLVGIAGDPAEVAPAVASYHFGSLLFGSTSGAALPEIQQVTQADQALATKGATARVRFFIAADQEGGEVQRLQGPGFSAIPPALVQGEWSSGTLQQDALTWGRQLRQAGLNLDLAPVMDVVPPGTAAENQPIGVLEREFGYDPGTVAVHGVAFVRGMQQAGIATTAKHFPGLGRVQGNTDFSSGVVDATTGPDDPYLGSFQAAIDAGIPFVMIALANYPRIDPAHLAVFSPAVMRTMLRGQMGFRGVIVSDDLGAAVAVSGMTPAARAIDFIAAGGDMITSESLSAATEMAAAVRSQMSRDPAFRSDVNAAVLHILTAKQSYGLLSCAQ